MKLQTHHLTNKITWSEFEQPHRNIDSDNFRNYADFAFFSFDTKNYLEQLQKLRRTF